MRALAFHLCGPGSNPGVDAICGRVCCWFSLLLREVFSLETPADVTKTGNGERGAGSGEWGAGSGERKSGNELPAETSIKIQYGR